MSIFTAVPRSNLQWHRFLAWLGAIILLIYIISAVTHPLMSWTGPKAQKFFPPVAKIQSQYLQAIPTIIQQHKLQAASVIKIVPSKDAPLLQVTMDNQSVRRYFDLNSYLEKPDYDKEQAAWLASYYMNDKALKIRSIVKQDDFDQRYPWVNRLLPVYKVTLEDSQNTTLYVYTELNALASISNNWKTGLQNIFQVLHTWNFLDDVDNARVILLALMMLTLIAFIVTGIALVCSLRSRHIKQTARRWHRRLAYFIWLPLLGFSSSGFYHLLQSAYAENKSGLRLNKAIDLSAYPFTQELQNFEQQDELLFNHISLVKGSDEQLLYRVSLPSKHPHGKAGSHKSQSASKLSRAARYQGVPLESGAYYIDAVTGELSTLTDKAFAKAIATDYLQAESNTVEKVSLVTRFGPNYDFRNKRLPVWRIDFNNDNGDTLFVDPATRIIVDQTTQSSRYERYSFSFLHKWNMLVPLVGRKNRDILVVAVLLLSLFFTITGIVMLIKKRKPS